MILYLSFRPIKVGDQSVGTHRHRKVDTLIGYKVDRLIRSLLRL